jgi:DNA-binding NarL/FixJ family response regulator
MVIAGEASRLPEAPEQVRRCKPNVVILEPYLAGISGLAIIRAIRQWSPTSEILVFTACCMPGAARAALDAGGRGYALKSEEPSEIVRAVRCVLGHKPYITPHLDQEDHLSRQQLSQDDLAVITLLAGGFHNGEIAFVLGISKRTVEAHRRHLMRKLQCQSFSELIRFALRRQNTESFDQVGRQPDSRACPKVFPERVHCLRAARSESSVLSESLPRVNPYSPQRVP